LATASTSIRGSFLSKIAFVPSGLTRSATSLPMPTSMTSKMLLDLELRHLAARRADLDDVVVQWDRGAAELAAREAVIGVAHARVEDSAHRLDPVVMEHGAEPITATFAPRATPERADAYLLI
jgi:hypothetical protein